MTPARVGRLSLLLAATLVTGCVGTNDTSSQSSTDVTIKARDKLRFEPTTIEAKVGQTVSVLIDNVSHGDHSFRIDALNVDSGAVPAGQQSVVTFIAAKSGRFNFYSAQPGERTGGMVGTLIVTD